MSELLTAEELCFFKTYGYLIKRKALENWLDGSVPIELIIKHALELKVLKRSKRLDTLTHQIKIPGLESRRRYYCFGENISDLC